MRALVQTDQRVNLLTNLIRFDLEKIHSTEKESLPEFFQGKPSKSPEIYKKYRNFIV